MTTKMPAMVFAAKFNKPNLKAIFDEYIAAGAAVGRDGITLDMFKAELDAEIDIILRKVKTRSYEFTSYREKLISKGADKAPRQLSIPTIRDKLVLKFLSQLLAEIYPEQVSLVPHSTVKKVHERSSLRAPTDYYLRLDIKSYFPSIDHKILLRILRRRIRSAPILHLIENAIRTPTGVKKHSKTLKEKGVPQGLSVSNILSSIYLAEIDELLAADQDLDYFRFVDDILIIAAPERIIDLEKSLPALLWKKRKVKCHEVGEGSKSAKVQLDNGIDYLGYRFLLGNIEVRQSSFKKMFANLIKVLTAIRYAKSKGRAIWKLNLRITGCQLMKRHIGWLFFFSQSENAQQLKQLDAFVTKHAKRILPPVDRAKIRRFVKAYHEIRYHRDETDYFPNFDDFSTEQKKAQISLLLPKKSPEFLDALPADELDDLFQKCLRHEIADLEKDMMEVFS